MRKSDRSTWKFYTCPVIMCGWRSKYYRSIKRHLEHHGFEPSLVEAELRIWMFQRRKLPHLI